MRDPLVIILSVHPRVCGEHVASRADALSRNGSSPRVRGTPADDIAKSNFWRFIPACAGNTSSCNVASSALAVHPRVCGEHTVMIRATITNTGSSPRVRGTRFIPDISSHSSRFIPACAGNTHTYIDASLIRAVHPRVCGEHITTPYQRGINSGSSPRVRGTQCVFKLDFHRCRFIPACAGNTGSVLPWSA